MYVQYHINLFILLNKPTDGPMDRRTVDRCIWLW